LRPDGLATEFRLLQAEAVHCFEVDLDPLRKTERIWRAFLTLIDELKIKVGNLSESAPTVHGLFLWALNPLGIISTFVFAFEFLFAMPPVFGKNIEAIQATLEGYLRRAISVLAAAGLFQVDLYGLMRCGRVEKRVAFFTGAKGPGENLETEDIIAILGRTTRDAIPKFKKNEGVKILAISCPNFLRPTGRELIRYVLLTMNFSDQGNGDLLGRNDWDLVVNTYNGKVKETISFLKSIPRRVPRKVIFALGGRPDALAKVVDSSNWIELPREFLTLRDDDERRSLLFEAFETLLGR
jgi:hypothetical protein